MNVLRMVADAKKRCVRIGTHSGTFHCDEALACFMLQLLPQYKDSQIIRTRDPKVLDECDVVVDVGAIYDPSKHRYDHHQRSFNETLNTLTDGKLEFNTKLSSAGLIYHHFGREVINVVAPDVSDDHKDLICKRIYEYFMEEVDAVDNGINPTDEVPRYHITTTIGGRVRALNPAWNDDKQDPDSQFEKAKQMVGEELLARIRSMSNIWLPALKLVKEGFDKRFEVHPTGEIMVLENGGCPWKEHLYTLEAEAQCEGQVKYVLYTDQNGAWRIQAVGVKGEGFKNRLSLPESWRGVRDEKLEEVSGIPGSTFVHASGFTGGNKTRDGALEMGRISLKLADNS